MVIKDKCTINMVVIRTTKNVIALMYENYTIPIGTTMANWTYRYSLQSGGSCLASFSILY